MYNVFFFELSKNIKSATRHLKFIYILTFTNVLRTDKETKSFLKKLKHHIQLYQLKNIKIAKSRLKRSIKMLLNRSVKICYVQVTSYTPTQKAY